MYVQFFTSFRLDQIENICRGQFKSSSEVISVFSMVENMVGNIEMASYQHLLLFLQCFQGFLPTVV